MKIGVAFSGSGAGAAAAKTSLPTELLKRSVAGRYALGDLAAAVPSLLWSRRGGAGGARRADDPVFGVADAAAGTPAAGSNGDVPRARGVRPCGQLCRCLHRHNGDLFRHAALGRVEPQSPVAFRQRTGGARLRAESLPGQRAVRPARECGCATFPFVTAARFSRSRWRGWSGSCPSPSREANPPAQVAADTLSALTGKNADLHYDLRFGGADIPEKIRTFVEEHIAEIYEKLLF